MFISLLYSHPFALNLIIFKHNHGIGGATHKNGCCGNPNHTFLADKYFPIPIGVPLSGVYRETFAPTWVQGG